MRPLHEAPTDGTRFLALVHTHGYVNGAWKITGTQVVEAWFNRDHFGRSEFVEWCGNSRTSSTGGGIEGRCLGWIPMPEEFNRGVT